MDKRHVINLQGREYVTYEGLLDEAHKRGLKAIRTTLLQLPGAANEQTAIVAAEVEFAETDGNKVFTGIGDANPRNVSRSILPHLIRMAETRAKARALRDGTNIGMTAFEELEVAELPREVGDFARVTENAVPDVASLTNRQAAKAGGTKLAGKSLIDAAGREMKRTGLTAEAGREYLREHFGKISRSELTVSEIEAFIQFLRSLPNVATA